MLRAVIAILAVFMTGTPCFAAQQAPAEAAETAAAPITITSLRFTGNTLFDNEELSVVLLHYLQRPLGMEDLYAAADDLAAFYRSKGYGLVSVIVPPQDVTDGIVNLEILEGYIGGVEITGETGLEMESLEPRMQSATPGNALNTEWLQRDLLALNDLPGLRARAIISPSLEYGKSDIELRVEEDPWEFATTVDTFGRESLGRTRFGLQLRSYHSLATGDAFSAGLMVSEDNLLRYLNLDYDVPLGSSNDRLQFSVNRAEYEAGEEFAALGIIGENNFARIGYTSILHREADTRLALVFRISRFDTLTEVTKLPLPNSESRLLLGELGTAFDFEDADTRFNASLLLSGNGTHNRSTLFNRDPDSQRAKLALDMLASQAFAKRYWVQARFMSGYSRETLPDSQQFSIGGQQSVRGFEPAVGRGDAGYALQTEMHRAIWAGNWHGSFSLQLDAARSFRWLFPGEPLTAPRDLRLGSAGLGMRLSSPGGFNLQLSAHQSIYESRDDIGLDDNTKFWISMSQQF